MAISREGSGVGTGMALGTAFGVALGLGLDRDGAAFEVMGDAPELD